MLSERQKRMLEHMARHDYVTVPQLSALLKVSPSTVRRELADLDAMGVIERRHGGAGLPAPIQYEAPYEKRAAQQVEGKRVIAAAARRLIAPGAVIGLSGGTTCTELARQLRFQSDITVVTNAINVAVELYNQPGLRVMVTGGLLNHRSYELVGSQVSESLRPVHLDVAFFGVSGVDPHFGFSMTDESEVASARAFIAAADKAIVLTDHTKIGKRTFARLCALDEVDLLITDSGISEAQRALLSQTSLKVEIADIQQS